MLIYLDNHGDVRVAGTQCLKDEWNDFPQFQEAWVALTERIMERCYIQEAITGILFL